jgi:methylenetetrahydrofolate dehydrogenase (NADP+)/methenyltetrahydrofolate cyclohydrolase
LSAQVLDGLALAREIRESLKERVQALTSLGVVPRLDVIVASQDPSSIAYVNMKRRWCEMVGIAGESFSITDGTTQDSLISKIRELNADPQVHGVLIQHPLPSHLDEHEALLTLGSEKDVDGITPQSLGRLVADLPGFRCATPLGMIRLLERYDIDVTGKNALVIGRSVIVGKPAALMLLQKNATVTVAHSKTRDLADLCRSADVVVAAVGRPQMVRGDWIKPGATVIDAGYNKVEGVKGDVGDVHFDEVSEVAGAITPVPGGVGPMTVACLLSNAVKAAEIAAYGHQATG